jgi:hypothetical protein
MPSTHIVSRLQSQEVAPLAAAAAAPSYGRHLLGGNDAGCRGARAYCLRTAWRSCCATTLEVWGQPWSWRGASPRAWCYSGAARGAARCGCCRGSRAGRCCRRRHHRTPSSLPQHRPSSIPISRAVASATTRTLACAAAARLPWPCRASARAVQAHAPRDTKRLAQASDKVVVADNVRSPVWDTKVGGWVGGCAAVREC